ncbi:MAG: energy transducer TonB [Bacteroidales bacterium]
MKKFIIPFIFIFFLLPSFNNELLAQDDEIFVVVDEQPRFKGGEKARTRYLINEINYPKEALESEIEGVVFIEFIVEKDGSISNAKVKRGVHELLDREALRVVKNMPNWSPGEQEGKPVRVKQNIPIRFKLDMKVNY